jgi:hypothetical protein
MAAKRKKHAAAFRDVPKRATGRWVKLIYRCLELLGKADCFASFAPDPAKAAILAMCQVGPLSVAGIAAVSQWNAPPVLTLTADQEQVQITGVNFMKDALGLRVVLFRDIFHRIHNDCTTAMANAGLMPIFYAAIVILNLGYGPYQTAGWWHSMLAEAAELGMKATPDNPALVKLWPWIERSRKSAASPGSSDGVCGGVASRRHFLQEMDFTVCMKLKAVKVKLGQWMSFPQAYHAHKQHLAGRAFVVTNYVIDNNYATNIADLEAAVAKHSFAVKEAAAKSKTKAIQNAKAKIDDFKQRAKHHLLLAAKLFLDPDVTRGMAAISLGVAPIFDWFSHVERELKGRDACSAFSQSWATFGWLEPLKATLRVLSDDVGLGEVGLTMAFRSELLAKLTENDPAVLLEDARARMYHCYIMNLVQETAGSMSWWTSYYPGKMAAVLGEATAEAALQALKSDCNAWWYAKEPRCRNKRSRP